MQQPASYAATAWNQWAYRLEQRVAEQERQLQLLQARLEDACRLLERCAGKPTYNVEKLEYNFDQLKVDTLEGTLNVGMTPTESGQIPGIEQACMNVVPQQAQQAQAQTQTQAASPAEDSEMRALSVELEQYLQAAGPQLLAELEQQNGLQLDPYHRRMVVADILKQLQPRIQHYWTASMEPGANPASLSGEQRSRAVASTREKTARDIRSAMEQYILGLKGAATP